MFIGDKFLMFMADNMWRLIDGNECVRCIWTLQAVCRCRATIKDNKNEANSNKKKYPGPLNKDFNHICCWRFLAWCLTDPSMSINMYRLGEVYKCQSLPVYRNISQAKVR